MSSTLQVIEAKMRELERKLSASPIYRELVILREARDKLLSIGAAISGISSAPDSGNIQHRGPAKRVTILDGARMALNDAGHPLTSRMLVELLPKYGAYVGGAKPPQNLTSILSKRADDFESIRWEGKRAWWFRARSLPDEVLAGNKTPDEKAADHADKDEPAAGSTSNEGGQHAAALA